MSRKRRKRVDPRQARMLPAQPGWRWRTLPVWLALTGGFTIGWYVAAFGSGRYPDNWSYFVQLAVLSGFALGLSRIMRWLTERWILRRREKTGDGVRVGGRDVPERWVRRKKPEPVATEGRDRPPDTPARAPSADRPRHS
jgi:hypothetical protein